MPNQSSLPDNLKSRISRIYVVEKSFKDQVTKQDVKYNRLVLDLFVKGESYSIEFKPEKADITLLRLADIVDKDLLDEDEE